MLGESIHRYQELSKNKVIKPFFGEKSIVEIPRTFLYRYGFDIEGINKDLLDALDKEKTIFILLDAVGFNIFYKFIIGKRNYRKILDKAKYIDVLTSTIPSTTVTALTSLYTGEYPGQHGIIGYKMYLPEAGSVIKVLSFSPNMCPQREMLRDSGVKINLFLNDSTLFVKLNELGVKSYVLTYEGHLSSTFSQKITEGANLIGDISLIDALTLLFKISESDEKLLIYTYIGLIDALSHKYGPFSQHVRYALEIIFNFINDLVDKIVKKNVNLVISADHGQLRVFKKYAYFFDKLCNRCGLRWIIPPFGEKRFAYFYSGGLSSYKEINECFGEMFQVYRSKDAIDLNFFGPTRDKKILLSRIGDIILSGKGNNLLIYPYRKDDLELDLRGHHGGLSPDEMLVPIIVF